VTSTRFRTVGGQRVIEDDWYQGSIPAGAAIDPTAYVGSSYSFCRYRSELPVGVEIGPYALVSWEVMIMDSYRVPVDPDQRRRFLHGDTALLPSARPVRLGRNSWVGFGATVLPGVTIGEGSIVAARSVVASDVPPYVVVAGNPARVVRPLEPGDPNRP